MEHRMRLLTWTVLAGAALALTLAAEPGWAQVIDPVAEVTDVINFNSVKIRGQYVFDTTVGAFGNLEQPFFTQVFADQFDCLRLDVDVSSSVQPHLQMVVVAPNGTVWRDDDSGSCSLCPLVKLLAPVKGWYTVQLSVSPFSIGNRTIEFRLRYGRYNGFSFNCANPTPPH